MGAKLKPMRKTHFQQEEHNLKPEDLPTKKGDCMSTKSSIKYISPQTNTM